MTEGFSRRGVLGRAGWLAAGAAATRLVGGTAPVDAGPLFSWPWPYVKLDPAEAAELAYAEWGRLFCGAAVIHGVFSQLEKRLGEPYASFPVEGFVFLEGGIAGWGTICGCCAGANVVSNLIAGPRISGSPAGMQIGAALLDWYCERPLPTFAPGRPRVAAEIARTTAGSPLCHVSVGRWMKATGAGMGSPERMERCARVTASVTYRLVELLNAWKDGAPTAASPSPAREHGLPAQRDCGSCHSASVPSPPGKPA